jgi:hypothetical protein
MIVRVEVKIWLKEDETRDACLFTRAGELFVNITYIRSVSDEPGILISRLGVRALAWDIIEALTMLALIPSDHIHGLLEQIEIEVLIGK